jgi:hypothetical protein
VRLLDELAKIHATFDDPHRVSQAGLIPVMAPALWGSKTGRSGLTCRFDSGSGVRLTASRACDPTDALPDVRPPGWLDGAARTFCSLQRRGVAGAASGGCGAAAAEP